MKNRNLCHACRVITILVVVRDRWLSAATAVEWRPNVAIILADDLDIGVDLWQPYAKQLRKATVLHSKNGRLAIRKGGWKLIQWEESKGWAYPKTKNDLTGLPRFPPPPPPPYNYRKDPAEKTNLISCLPEIVEELKTQIEKYVTEGRSPSVVRQINDGPARWSRLEWMKKCIADQNTTSR